MLEHIRKFYETRIAPMTRNPSSQEAEPAYRLATAALLVEMTRADYDVKEEERLSVTTAIQKAFGLSAKETDELVRLAELEAENATSLYEFTSLINAHFSPEQKQRVVELLWRVAFADGQLDKYEEHLVRKVADLIYVPHGKFIQSKHKVKSDLGVE
jgi:uncharacterized tellurite resistance protein B-like protein